MLDAPQAKQDEPTGGHATQARTWHPHLHARPGGRSVRFAVIVSAAIVGFQGHALAQTPVPATGSTAAAVALAVRAPAAIEAAPASQVALGITVAPLDALPAKAFLRVRGLPPSVSLTEGHAIAAGAWAVPLNSLDSLKANLPAGYLGSTPVTLQLISLDGVVLAETRVTLVVAVPGGPPFAAPAAPRPPPLAPAARERAEKLIIQGERYLESGNIEIARQFFERAADAGLAEGAIRLAGTYDPAELARLHVQGVVPSPAQARRWYERARELGAPEADARLARIGM